MNIENIGPHVLRVAGLAIGPGRTGVVDAEAYAAWLAKSHRNRRMAFQHIRFVPKPPAKAGLYAAAEEAAGPDDRRNDGVLRMEYLRTRPGLEYLSVAERDELASRA